MQLQLTMTFGDLIVAGTTAIAVVGAYYAVKGNLQALTESVKRIAETVDGQGKKLEEHSETIARLDTRVFGGRRITDRSNG